MRTDLSFAFLNSIILAFTVKRQIKHDVPGKKATSPHLDSKF